MDEIFEKMNTELNEDTRPLNEMARVGNIYEKTYCVCVYDGERRIAHFHIFTGPAKYPDWETCIQFLKPEYFHHSGKEGTLDSGKKKDLIKFMNKMHKGLAVTNWQYAVTLWNDNNPQWEIDANTPMPDYLLLQNA